MGVKRTLLATLCLVTATGMAANDPYEEAAEAAMQGDHVLMQQRYERLLVANPDDVRALNGKATAQAWRAAGLPRTFSAAKPSKVSVTWS